MTNVPTPRAQTPVEPDSLYKGFRISLVAVQGGIVARIRRADGAEFAVARTLHSATATTPCPSQAQASDQARAIIDRIAGR